MKWTKEIPEKEEQYYISPYPGEKERFEEMVGCR